MAAIRPDCETMNQHPPMLELLPQPRPSHQHLIAAQQGTGSSPKQEQQEGEGQAAADPGPAAQLLSCRVGGST
ncbi:hypothetical protein HaLaN_21110, partial [Haematococcus lacustris]